MIERTNVNKNFTNMRIHHGQKRMIWQKFFKLASKG
uniref:Uncharacterized protein n=1 Tax=Rhizophora mucronata TaxID=61149 RepID=A0A2P2JVS6_RHIMU